MKNQWLSLRRSRALCAVISVPSMERDTLELPVWPCMTWRDRELSIGVSSGLMTDKLKVHPVVLELFLSDAT